MKEDNKDENSLSPMEINIFRTELAGMFDVSQILFHLCCDRKEIYKRGEINYELYPGSINLKKRLQLQHEFLSQKLFYKYGCKLPTYSELGIATYIAWESQISNNGLYLHTNEERYILSRFGSQLKYLIASPNDILADFSPIFEIRLKFIIDKINDETMSEKKRYYIWPDRTN